MAIHLSDYLEPIVLNLLLRDTAYTPASTIYLGLFSALSDDGGTVTEFAGDGYERPAVVFGAASAGKVTNQQVTFATPTADWPEATHVGLFDADSGGNLLFWGELAEPRTALDGEAPVFAAGDLTVDLIANSSIASQHIANALLNRILRNQSWTSITPWLALSRADPGVDGSALDEPGGGDSYARVNTTGDWSAAAEDGDGYESSNENAIEFPTASGGWGELTHNALMDASSGGNLILRAALDAPLTINNGETARYPIGECVWRSE